MLLIVECMVRVPAQTSWLYMMLNRRNTHTILAVHSDLHMTKLTKEISVKLLRGVDLMQLKPLSEVQATQRLVYAICSNCDFVPHNLEQGMLAQIAEQTLGSPDLVEVTAALIRKYIEYPDAAEGTDFLKQFYEDVCCEEDKVTIANDDYAKRLLTGFDLSPDDMFFLSTLSLLACVPIPALLVETIQLLVCAASPEGGSKMPPLPGFASQL